MNLGSLTTMDLSEIGGEYYSVCMKDFEASKLVGKKLRQADKHDKQTATIAQKALALATKKWKNRLLQLFEMPVYQFQILRFQWGSWSGIANSIVTFSSEAVVLQGSQDDRASVRESHAAQALVAIQNPGHCEERRQGLQA